MTILSHPIRVVVNPPMIGSVRGRVYKKSQQSRAMFHWNDTEAASVTETTHPQLRCISKRHGAKQLRALKCL